MPIEVVTRAGEPAIFEKCPNCGAEPFEPFLRFQVARRVYKYFVFGKWPFFAVICRDCKDIVGYE